MPLPLATTMKMSGVSVAAAPSRTSCARYVSKGAVSAVLAAAPGASPKRVAALRAPAAMSSSSSTAACNDNIIFVGPPTSTRGRVLLLRPRSPASSSCQRRVAARAALSPSSSSPSSSPGSGNGATSSSSSAAAASATSSSSASSSAAAPLSPSSVAASASPSSSSDEPLPSIYAPDQEDWSQSALTIVVVGASGDLARKKIYPALFALYYDGHLPPHFSVFGFARSAMTDEAFRDYISSSLTCRVAAGAKCGDAMSEFLKRCFYQPGQYSSDEAFARLAERAAAAEAPSKKADRIFYLSIPPSVFVDAASAATRAASSVTGWTRVIVEKPFGRDSDSYRALASELGRHVSEDATYRIDHYLGKELIENLTVLRFANLVFEPLWSRNYIRAVQVIFSEDFGTEGRG